MQIREELGDACHDRTCLSEKMERAEDVESGSRVKNAQTDWALDGQSRVERVRLQNSCWCSERSERKSDTWGKYGWSDG